MTRFLHTAVILGLITAVGPFAVDMYLPALPSIGANLHASPAAVQMSLTVFFIVIGIFQLGYGPFSDIVGRKPPIYGGLTIFALGSIGCALAPNIGFLIGFRIVQSFGACAGMVIPLAIVRDLHTGSQAARLMSLLMLVVSISPILAPVTGSLVIAAVGWRGVFGVLAGTAAIALLLAATQLKETRHTEHRAQSSWLSAFRAYGRLLADPNFIGLTFVSTFGISSFFVYIAGASFVFIDHFGLSPTLFSLCFAVNAASFFACSQLTGRLTQRFGLVPVVRIAVAGFALAMIALAALTGLGADSLALLMVFLFVGYGFLGLVLPSTVVLAMDKYGAVAGTASALMGSLEMITGAALMGVAGIFADGTPFPMAMGIAACAVAAFIVAQIVLRPASNAASVPAE